MDIFETDDYRNYIKNRLENAPKGGHGQSLKLSKALGISSTLFSQILSAQRQMNLEQGSLLSDYWGMSELESEYFLLLIQRARAGNESLRKKIDKQISKIKEKSQKVINRLQVSQIISNEDKTKFYSEWYYSAIRQMTAIPGYSSAEAIAEYLGLPMKIVNEVVHFLVTAGLCIEERGKLKVGPARTHIDADSPWIKMHHANWRNKALELINSTYSEKLHFSSPITLAKKDCIRVRGKIMNLIDEVGKIVDPSPSEELMCLNIDWFKVQPNK